MQANSAATGTITPQFVGHVFGRYGQGARTTPWNSEVEKPFIWETSSAGNVVGMSISLLPIMQSDNGVGDGQYVKINATVLEWQDKSLLTTKPTQPAAAVDPINQGTWLKTSSIVMAVGSSVYLSLF